jgi:methionyl-tRNA synthetase
VELGNVLVVCGLPYVNFLPHLGTLVQVLSADVVARYYQLKGEDVVLVSGSDDHGTPMEVEAFRLGISRKQLTGKNHAESLSYLGNEGFPLTITVEQRMLEKNCVSPSEPVKI